MHMDSIDKLKTSIGEIDILLRYAARNEQREVIKYQLFNKLSIILLATKLESFIEDFIEEHVEQQLRNHTIQTFSKELKERYFDTGIGLITEQKKREEKERLFRLLVTLYGDDKSKIDNLKDISPSTRFSYGKHGRKEIESLFERHGLGRFIRSEVSQNCLKKMDSLIAVRNNVIHQDAASGLTHRQVKDHKNNILQFVECLESDVQQNRKCYYNQI